jgi:hypothetical protein
MTLPHFDHGGDVVRYVSLVAAIFAVVDRGSALSEAGASAPAHIGCIVGGLQPLKKGFECRPRNIERHSVALIL